MSDKKVCIVCGNESVDLICESCKGKIQGEAAEKKTRMEKSVRIGSDVDADKKTKQKTND